MYQKECCKCWLITTTAIFKAYYYFKMQKYVSYGNFPCTLPSDDSFRQHHFTLLLGPNCLICTALNLYSFFNTKFWPNFKRSHQGINSPSRRTTGEGGTRLRGRFAQVLLDGLGIKGAQSYFVIFLFQNYWRFWYHKKAHIFLITHVIFYGWNMLRMEDID